MKEVGFERAGTALFWQALKYVGVKVIFLARLLVLARLLSPDDFGLLAVSSIVIDVLMRITNFGMVPALVQRVEAGDEHYNAAWTVGIFRAFAVTGVALIAAPVVAQLLAEPRAVVIIRALAARPLIDAAASIRIAELTRRLQFRSLALADLAKALANTAVSVLAAPWLGVWALVVGTLAGPIGYLIVSYMLAPHRPQLTFGSKAARSLVRYGQWVFFTSLVAMAGQSVLRVVITRQLGAAELGLYYLAASLAFIPADLASQVVGEVAFPFYARLQTDRQQAAVAFRSILTSLSILLLPALALMLVLAPTMVDAVLGPRWEGTARILQVLAMANIIGMLGDTIVPILQGTGRPDRVLVIEGVQSLLLISFVWRLTDRYGVVGAAMAWLPTLAVSQLVGVIFLRQTMRRPFAGLRPPLGAAVFISVIAAAGAAGIDALISGLAGFVVASLLGVALVGGLSWVLERRFGLGLFDGLARAFPRAVALVGLTVSEAG